MTEEMATLPTTELFREHFFRLEDRLADTEQPVFLQNIRKAALGKFTELGIPTQRDEDWKHTRLRFLDEIAFHPADPDESATIDILQGVVFQNYPSHRVVFVDGRFSMEQSDLSRLPEGVTLTPFEQAFTTHREILEKHFNQYAAEGENPAFVALNTALHEEGLLIVVGEGVSVEEPIHLIVLSTKHANPQVTHPRVLLVAEQGSEATFIERYAGEAGSVYLTNAVTEMVLGENAGLDHYRLQDESDEAYHICTVQVEQARGSRYRTHAVSIGSKLCRNGIAVRLDGEGIDCVMNGLFLAQGDQHVDNHTRVVHAQPHCSSHEVFKGILGDQSSGAFTGRIVVKPGAQKTDAIQSSKNLLLSDDASMTPDPQLEIFADDVKCTHGATVGQLDSDAIFYLRARGIDEDSARGLLTYAFANEIIEQIRIEPLRDYLEAIIARRYRGGTV